MTYPVVLDLETQNTFREVGGFEPKKLKISLVGLYDYSTSQYLSFTEDELSQLFPYLENASTIIGFNIINFDLPVLSSYYIGDVRKFPTIDLMKFVEKYLGFRVSLDSLVSETLGIQKNGHGLLAVEYFRNKEFDKLRQYCLSDVRLTRELFEYGKQHGRVFFKSSTGRREIPVSWSNAEINHSAQINLTLPW